MMGIKYIFQPALTSLLCSVILAVSSGRAAEAYVTMDATTGRILDSSNASKKAQIGSLTKVATAMVVLDWLEMNSKDLGELATVPATASSIGGVNAVGFQPGDRVSLRDLLYAALLQSDNIAAYTLADYVGQHLQKEESKATSVDHFVVQMNALARRLSMNQTLFLNPHGLDTTERKPPYSTAVDTALLTRYAVSKPSFRFYVSQKERRITFTRGDGSQSQYLLKNTNELLGIDAIDGVKTGKTRKAGECLILSAARPPDSKKEGNTYTITPRRLIVVLLGSTDRFNTAAELLKRGWKIYDEMSEVER